MFGETTIWVQISPSESIMVKSLKYYVPSGQWLAAYGSGFGPDLVGEGYSIDEALAQLGKQISAQRAASLASPPAP